MLRKRKARVFLVLVEVKPLPGCEMLEHGGIGGFVHCFVWAIGEKEAIARVYDSLQADHYEVMELKSVEDYEESEWESEEVQAEYDEYAHQARSTNFVIYGPFHTWVSDADEDEEEDVGN